MAHLATLVTIAVICLLFYLDRRPGGDRPSTAVWVPAIWIAIGASRNVSSWFGAGVSYNDTYTEGSPVDRNVQILLLTLAILALWSRRNRVFAFLRANWAILLFLGYCLVSILWSEFPLVTYKRWTKAFGDVLMVLVVLTDSYPLAAIKRLFASVAFFLIPLSVLFIKYFPSLGREYASHSGAPSYCGVAGFKNMLGALCLVFGLASLWRILEVLKNKHAVGRQSVIVAHGSIVLMDVWLLHMAHSSTSTACFLLGCAILLTLSYSRNRVSALYWLTGSLVFFGLVIYLFPDAYSAVVESLGRNRDLTGRTDIWAIALKMSGNPLIGVGYESFWVGPRVDAFQAAWGARAVEAHNGYLEIYLNLGWVGLLFLAIEIFAGYANVLRALRRDVPAAALKACFLLIAIPYNLSEAAFKMMSAVGIAFLFGIMAFPLRSSAQSETQAANDLDRFGDPVDEAALVSRGWDTSVIGGGCTAELTPKSHSGLPSV